ncbi:5-(carboxyamino)imidazole ribonucleotide mutase [Myxococcota bacterium]
MRRTAYTAGPLASTASVPLVGVIMGSKSDWDTMCHTADTLDKLGIAYEVRVLSAHRTPDQAIEYAVQSQARGLQVLIAGAGGAAHLGGILAAKTPVPVLGVPMQGGALSGLDALLSTVQMPAGVPVGTLAIGKAGAVNAALLAAAVLALSHPPIAGALNSFRAAQTQAVLATHDPRV